MAFDFSGLGGEDYAAPVSTRASDDARVLAGALGYGGRSASPGSLGGVMLPWESPTYYLLRAFAALFQYGGAVLLMIAGFIIATGDSVDAGSFLIFPYVPGVDWKQKAGALAICIALGTLFKGVAFVMEVASISQDIERKLHGRKD